MNKQEIIQEKLTQIKNLIEARFNEDEELDKLTEIAIQEHTWLSYARFYLAIERSPDLYNRLVRQEEGRQDNANAFLHNVETLVKEVKKLEENG